jgi:phage gp46-like protein
MRIIPLAAPAAPLLDPDIVWNGIVGDLAITSPTDADNPAGLRAGQALATAVLICLMTDARAEVSELRDGDVNRGWPGDAFDMADGDVPLGSKLWLLRRRPIDRQTAQAAEDYARTALQTLIDQGAFVGVEVTAAPEADRNRLTLDVVGYGQSGERRFDQRYAVLWDQIDGVTSPLSTG